MRISSLTPEKRHILRKVSTGALRFLALLLVIAAFSGILLSTGPIFESHAEDRITQDDIDDLKRQLEGLKKAKQEQKEELAGMEADKDTLQLALNSYTALSEQYYGELEKVRADIARCEQDQADCKQRIEDLQNKQARLYENYKSTLRVLRESRDVSVLELIFEASSLKELLSAVERAKDLAEYKRQILVRMQDSFEDLQDELKATNEELEKQRSNASHLEEMGAEVEGEIRDTEKLLTDLGQEILEKEQSILDLEETTDEIQKDLKDLIKAYEEQQERERLAKQYMLWPLDYPDNTRCTSRYGYRIHPIYHYYRFHSGVDLVSRTHAIYRDNVYSCMAGTVITCVKNRGTTGYGTYVIVSHGYSERYGGYLSTLYAHLDSVNVKTGDVVTQGQILGKVGTTGASTGPHLHFEVRLNGVTTDPLTYQYITAIGGEPKRASSFI